MRSQVRAFTMLDYLYRLRVKANYIDDELFSQGPEKDLDVRSSQLACSTLWPLPCSFTSCGLVSSSARDGFSTKRICGYKGMLQDQLHTA